MITAVIDLTKVLVIGAGAAGLMAAGTAASNGCEVVLVERNERPARKVMITGKGRCNVTNNCNLLNDLIANVPTNGRFFLKQFADKRCNKATDECRKENAEEE